MIEALFAYSAIITLLATYLAWDNVFLQRKVNVYHQSSKMNKVF
jgi:hypothetical protein